jgi:hypothetical protein
MRWAFLLKSVGASEVLLVTRDPAPWRALGREGHEKPSPVRLAEAREPGWMGKGAAGGAVL